MSTEGWVKELVKLTCYWLKDVRFLPPCTVWKYASGESYKKAKEHSNKVNQCCEVCKKPVCRKNSHKTLGVTCDDH